MALPTFDKKEQIPAGFEDEYEERDGKWEPIDHLASLKSALAEEKEARKKADVLARKAAKEAAEAATKKMASASGMSEEELRKIHQSIEATLKGEYEPKIAELETLRTEVRSLKLNDKVQSMFKEGGALPKHVADFWKLYGDEFDLTADGKPMVKNEPGKDVTKHVQAILKERSGWTQGTKASGSGSGANSGSGAGAGRQGGLSFEDVTKNPGRAIAVANEG